MQELKNQEEYIQHLKNYSSQEKESKFLKETLKQALDTRKFEIELYWKRANYFWAFIAASFAGYFAVLNSKNIEDFKSLTIIIALIGLLFSLGWYLVNRGSKYWQKNWETHVAFLEDEKIGPLFKTVLNPKLSKLRNLNSEYPFSVSKINQILSFTIFLIWIFIFCYSISYTFEIEYKNADLINLFFIILIFFTAIVMLIMDAESGLSRDIKKHNFKNDDEIDCNENEEKPDAKLISLVKSKRTIS